MSMAFYGLLLIMVFMTIGAVAWNIAAQISKIIMRYLKK